MGRPVVVLLIVAALAAAAGYVVGNRGASSDAPVPPAVRGSTEDSRGAAASPEPARTPNPRKAHPSELPPPEPRLEGPPAVPRPSPPPVETQSRAGPYPHDIRVVEEGGAIFLEIANGRLELVFRDGVYQLVPHGRWRDWRPTGEVLQDGEYEHGAKTGDWTTYHPDGSTESRGRYAEGKLDGEFTRWHANGQRAEVSRFTAGTLDGQATSWHANGAVASRGEWSGGRKVGSWETFDERGRLVRRERWEEGVLAGPPERWDPDGTWPTEEAALARASIDGKYADLAVRIEAPEDRERYGDLHDYGHYPATDYLGVRGVPEGYWVYSFPYWFIWRTVR